MPPEQEQCFACSGPDDFGFEVNDGTTPGQEVTEPAAQAVSHNLAVPVREQTSSAVVRRVASAEKADGTGGVVGCRRAAQFGSK